MIGDVSEGRVAILLQTHVFTARTARLYHALRNALHPGDEIFVLMHVPPGTEQPTSLREVPTHFVTTTEIRVPAYSGKSGGADWNIWSGGHTDLIALHFAQAHPEFAHYWVVEYDIRFTGRWKSFFDHFRSNRADLLTTSLRTFNANPDWSWWSTLKSPEGAQIGGEDRLCGFMPIFRFSRAAAVTMDRLYRQGWTGHCEATWPSLLRRSGLRIEDLGGKGEFVATENRGQFYINSPLSTELWPGTLVWRPASFIAGWRRNRLYHPIKPPRAALADQITFRTDRFKAYMRRMSNWISWTKHDTAGSPGEI